MINRLRRRDKSVDEWLRRAASVDVSIPSSEIRAIASRVVSEKRSIARSAHRVRPTRATALVAAALLALVAVTAAAGVTGQFGAAAEQLGFREEPPPAPAANYAPAAVPYISVQPLMRYAGRNLPVVPASALTRRGGHDAVFVLGETVTYRDRENPVSITVRERPVVVGKAVGRTFIVPQGLSPCDRVVVAPPDSLEDGAKILSFHPQSSATGVTIDYEKLFAGIAAAPAPEIGGGISREVRGSLLVVIDYQGDAPPDAMYRFQAADGTVRTGTYQEPYVELLLPKSSVRRGEPIGDAEIRDRSSAVIARNKLEWYCIP